MVADTYLHFLKVDFILLQRFSVTLKPCQQWGYLGPHSKRTHRLEPRGEGCSNRRHRIQGLSENEYIWILQDGRLRHISPAIYILFTFEKRIDSPNSCTSRGRILSKSHLKEEKRYTTQKQHQNVWYEKRPCKTVYDKQFDENTHDPATKREAYNAITAYVTYSN